MQKQKILLYFVKNVCLCDQKKNIWNYCVAISRIRQRLTGLSRWRCLVLWCVVNKQRPVM